MANLLEILKSTFGVSGQPTSEQEATQMTGFDNAGLSLGETPPGTTGEGTAGTTGGTTGGGGVVFGGGAQTTGGKKDNKGDGTGTSVTVAGEAGKEKKQPKSEVLGEALVFGGTAYDEGTRARKLQEAIKQRPLTNQDFFPDTQVLRESRTAWGDPIFTGAGQLFPMAVLDAQRKARAEAAAEAEAEAVLKFEPPKINVPALRATFVPKFIDEAQALASEGVKKYGSYKAWIREGRKDGSIAKFMNKWNSLADGINTTADLATDFVNRSKESGNQGLYFSPTALKNANLFLTGQDAWSKGEITDEDMLTLQNQFQVGKKWSAYLEGKLKDLETTDIIPLIEAETEKRVNEKANNTNTPEYEEFVRQITLPGAPQDYRTYLYEKMRSQVTREQALNAVVKPFFRDVGALAFEQAVIPREGENLEDAQKRAIQDLVTETVLMKGLKRQVGEVNHTPSASTKIYTGTGDKPGETYYQDVFTKTGEIVGNTKKIVNTLNQQKSTGQQRIDLAKKGFQEMFRKISNKGEVTPGYIGYEPIKVQTYDIKSAPVPYSEYKKYNPQTRKYESMTHADFGIDAQKFQTSRPEGNPVLNKLELVMLQPDGSTIPWDGTTIPTGSELHVAMTHLVDVEKPGQTMDGRAPAKTKTAVTVAPLSQMGKQLDDLFQRLSKGEKEAGAQGGAFKF